MCGVLDCTVYVQYQGAVSVLILGESQVTHTQAPQLAYLAHTQKASQRYCIITGTMYVGVPIPMFIACMISTLRVLYIMQLNLLFFRSKDDLPWTLLLWFPVFKARGHTHGLIS